MEGQTVSHYRILEKIGEGGMGQVYLAEDTSLERKVALKFLPLGLQTDPVAHKRFVREAKSAAAIDHPYICNIHEVAQTDDGQDYIVMEFVEGQTLKDRLEEGRIPIKEALQIGSEVAEALEKAHSAGVVHRDLKPSNIMITPEGHAKVLDFGLAKRITRDKEDLTSVLTREGTTLGTLAYMSPEQLRGSTVDTRADVFSLGVVLYEMLTGLHPFRTGTQAETVNAILSEHPSTLSRYVEGVPDLLQHTIKKMLAKQPGERYQTVHEIRTNLSKVMEEITSPTPLAEPEKNRGLWIGVAALVVLGIGLIVSWWYLSSRGPGMPNEPMRVVPFTSEAGRESYPAFSPDGSELAFVWRKPGEEQSSIYVKRLDGERSLQLTDYPGQELYPAWSPDGSQIAFWRQISEEESGIFVVSPLGGEARRLILSPWPKLPAGGLSWSPDGKSLAYSAKDSAEEPSSICLFSTRTGDKQKLTSPPRELTGRGDRWPEFSPDGKYLAFCRAGVSQSGFIYILPLEGGEPRRLTDDPDLLAGLTWTGDSQEIVFSSARGSNWGLHSLLRVSVSGNNLKRIDAAREGAIFPTISPAGDHLAYVLFMSDRDILKLELQGIDRGSVSATELIASTRWEQDPHISPDGSKIAFCSSRSGQYQIWTCNSDGSDPMRLTDFEASDTSAPSWSPNGQFIAFNSTQAGHFNIYVMGSQGGPARQLTTDEATDALPSWSQDGRWIYFCSNRSGDFQIWKLPAEGGIPIQVTTKGGFKAQESSDGKFLYYVKGENWSDLWKMPVQGGEETLILEHVHRRGWALTERGVYVLDDSTKPQPSIQFFDFAAGQLKHVTDVTERLWLGGDLTVAPDGSYLLYVRHELEEDIMLVENFQ